MLPARRCRVGRQHIMGRAARVLVALLPLLNVAWCYSYSGFAVPEGMKTAVFAGGKAHACVRASEPVSANAE